MDSIQFYSFENDVCLYTGIRPVRFTIEAAELLREQLSNAIKEAREFIAPIYVPNPILAEDIDSIIKDTRIIKRLNSIGIKTFNDLVRHEEIDLLRIEGFGRKCLNAVCEVMIYYNLQFRSENLIVINQ